jgi:hypothetical protein
VLLTEVKAALRARGRATLSQLAAETGIEPRFLDAALAHWEQKGRVRRHRGLPEACSPVACKSCPLVPLCNTKNDASESGAEAGGREDAGGQEFYEWIESPTAGSTQVPTVSESLMQSMV